MIEEKSYRCGYHNVVNIVQCGLPWYIGEAMLQVACGSSNSQNYFLSDAELF